MLFAVPLAPGTARAEPECAPAAKDSVAGVPWAQQRLAPEQAWGLTRGGGELVAVVGTGVSSGAPALKGSVLAGRDVRTGGRADSDCPGHGTFVAGLIAASPQPKQGLAGVAPAARILPVRVTDDQDDVDAAMLARGIRAAVDGGAGVVAVTVSAGSGTKALRAAVAYAKKHDVVLVASTDRPSTLTSDSTVAYPAALPGVLAVASVSAEGSVSNAAGSGRPLLAAPGENLISVAPKGSGQVSAGGSGVATGFAAGAAALVRAYRPDLTAPQVIARLEATADHPSGDLPDAGLGYGIVDPTSAVTTDLTSEEDYRADSLVSPVLDVPLATSPDTGPRSVALLVSGVALGSTTLVALVFSLVREARRRRRQPVPVPSGGS
ncbi:S8 family serine peptidase [Kineosporia sp. J2-2]|uniref:S8 family serine peptidase n=1 Tax=Kineosporia corallincola TaxID=2835133 RepID=A0ABS5TGH2_9ACTN|nr:S8 family serine peptidase [Kineosporia corallincola]MBT0770193.1 S8 family serine peptidase [Kineosporia corallincola]